MRRIEVSEARALSAAEETLTETVLVDYAALAFAAYSDAAGGVRELLTVVDAFVGDPSEHGLIATRNAWVSARRPYLQTEVFRFYDGPIDELETFINTWPIDENFVESGAGAARPGIIEDSITYPALSTGLLISLNAKEGETSISTGYHVIEFLLWGRDTHAHGPGARRFTDYEVKPPQAATTKRRAQYLRLATQLLLEQLEVVRDSWAPATPGNYRQRFLGLPRKQALGLVIKGMGALSGPELAGERLTVAYETKNQENEHSCFSDTTHLDVRGDTLGVQNICLGSYQKTDGSRFVGHGLCELVRLRDAVLGERLQREIEASVNQAQLIPAPFDQAILGSDDAPGRTAIQQTVAALQRQTQTLSDVAAAFDIRLSLAGVRAQR